MPRQAISEFSAKTIINRALDYDYRGLEIDSNTSLKAQLEPLEGQVGTSYVVKVDQAIKGRFKKGLVALNVPPSGLQTTIKEINKIQPFRYFLVEPMVVHAPKDERYLSIMRTKEGPQIYWYSKGGIDVEQTKLHKIKVEPQTDWPKLATQTGLQATQLKRLVETFDENHFTFLEINPYVIDGQKVTTLDLAVEVDSAASHFVESWSEQDFRSLKPYRTPQEKTVAMLAKKSPASFRLDILNPDGAIFLLLSGGGASITIADEVYNQGHGEELANYGEYSGDPNPEESYIYTRALLETLLLSKARRKVLFIGGAVANFTDIVNTFKGVVQALNELGDELQTQGLKVFVRRGGPREEEGLKLMTRALKKQGLYGAVHDASTPLVKAVAEMLKELS